MPCRSPSARCWNLVARVLPRLRSQIGMGIMLVYICISLLLQTKDDFRFIIPYVEFTKDVKGPQAVHSGHERGD